MRRHGRWVLRGLTVLSLVVSLAALMLWVRSKCVTRIDIWALSPTLRIFVEGGVIEIERTFPNREMSEQYEYTVIPYCVIGWVAAVVPTARLDGWLRRRRRMRQVGRCSSCRYNLL